MSRMKWKISRTLLYLSAERRKQYVWLTNSSSTSTHSASISGETDRSVSYISHSKTIYQNGSGMNLIYNFCTLITEFQHITVFAVDDHPTAALLHEKDTAEKRALRHHIGKVPTLLPSDGKVGGVCSEYIFQMIS